MATIKANQNGASFISNPFLQDGIDSDWVKQESSMKYKLPAIVVENDSTNTALKSSNLLTQSDVVRVYNATDGVKDGVLGAVTSAGVSTVGTHNIFGDGSCIATYRLDGNANDLGGNYNGTATNVSYAAGKYGNAGVFNGSSSWVNISPVSLSLAPYSFNLSVKIGSIGASYQALRFQTSTSNMGLAIDTNGKVVFGQYTSSVAYPNVTSAAPVDLNVFTTIACMWDGSSLFLYVNGLLEGTTPCTSMRTYNTPICAIGKYETGQYFNGSIDQVRIFNRALTATEVTALHNENSLKYTADISALALTVAPTKAYKDTPVTMDLCVASTEAKCVATANEYIGVL